MTEPIARSNKPEVRNPVLMLPSVAKYKDLPAEAHAALLAFLVDVRADAGKRGDEAWSKRKDSSAGYWKVVAVYAGHLVKALRRIARAAT